MRRAISFIMKKPLVEKEILKQTKNKGNIIYGARSIQKHLGIFSRPTDDYDIFSKNPESDAKQMDKKLDSLYGFNYHYTKKGMHKGTHKVKNIGYDMKKNTRDDESVVDYTKPDKKVKYKEYGGIKYRVLSEELKAKRKALADKEFAFRHKKDMNDLIRIQSLNNSSKLLVPVRNIKL